MGKGRWQPGAANRNQAGPQGQRLEPGNEHGLSEPCAVKSRMHGSSGGKAPQGAYLSQSLHEDKTVIQQAQAVAAEWLRGMGVELKPSKTRIAHTLYEQEGRVGFDLPSLPGASVCGGQNALSTELHWKAAWVQNHHHPKQGSHQTPSPDPTNYRPARQRGQSSGAYHPLEPGDSRLDTLLLDCRSGGPVRASGLPDVSKAACLGQLPASSQVAFLDSAEVLAPKPREMDLCSGQWASALSPFPDGDSATRESRRNPQRL